MNIHFKISNTRIYTPSLEEWGRVFLYYLTKTEGILPVYTYSYVQNKFKNYVSVGGVSRMGRRVFLNSLE